MKCLRHILFFRKTSKPPLSFLPKTATAYVESLSFDMDNFDEEELRRNLILRPVVRLPVASVNDGNLTRLVAKPRTSCCNILKKVHITYDKFRCEIISVKRCPTENLLHRKFSMTCFQWIFGELLKFHRNLYHRKYYHRNLWHRN